uniref:Gamma-tubulin complex component n=1 Tax=Macrostomum lignano TaxID=282301 RepID=A0A1I8H5U8_9PLAT
FLSSTVCHAQRDRVNRNNSASVWQRRHRRHGNSQQLAGPISPDDGYTGSTGGGAAGIGGVEQLSPQLSVSDGYHDDEEAAVIPPSSEPLAYSWLHRGRPVPPELPYLTEAGPAALDIALAAADRPPNPPVNSRVSREKLCLDAQALMIGLASVCFPLSSNRDDSDSAELTVRAGLAIEGCTSESLARLLRPLLVAGGQIRKLRHLLTVGRRMTDVGQIASAFLGCLESYLNLHESLVLSAYSPSCGPIQLVVRMRPLCQQVELVYQLCCPSGDSSEFDKFISGGMKLLNRLEAALAGASPLGACQFERLLLTHFLTESSRPYLRRLHDWVHTGLANAADASNPWLDANNLYTTNDSAEFPVVCNPDYASQRSVGYWRYAYSLRQQQKRWPLLPADASTKLFFCGKSVNLLRLLAPKHPLLIVTTADGATSAAAMPLALRHSIADLELVAQASDRRLAEARQAEWSARRRRAVAERQRAETLRSLAAAAREASAREFEAMQAAIGERRRAELKAKREQVEALKREAERARQAKADTAAAEAAETERALAAVERERRDLEDRVRQELLAGYARLTNEAAKRELRALWRLQRRRWDQRRVARLAADEARWKQEMIDATNANPMVSLDQAPSSVDEPLSVIASQPFDVAADDISQFAPSDVTASEAKPSDVAASEAKPSDVAASEVKPSDVAASEVKPSDVAASEAKPSDVAASEVKPSDVAASEVKPSDVAASEAKPSDVAASEFKLSDVAAGEIKPSNVAAGEVKPSDVAASEVKPSDVAATKEKPFDVSASETKHHAVVQEIKSSNDSAIEVKPFEVAAAKDESTDVAAKASAVKQRSSFSPPPSPLSMLPESQQLDRFRQINLGHKQSASRESGQDSADVESRARERLASRWRNQYGHPSDQSGAATKFSKKGHEREAASKLKPEKLIDKEADKEEVMSAQEDVEAELTMLIGEEEADDAELDTNNQFALVKVPSPSAALTSKTTDSSDRTLSVMLAFQQLCDQSPITNLLAMPRHSESGQSEADSATTVATDAIERLSIATLASKSLWTPLQVQASIINSALVTQLLYESNGGLLRHLRRLRRFCFLADGRFAQTFIELATAEAESACGADALAKCLRLAEETVRDAELGDERNTQASPLSTASYFTFGTIVDEAADSVQPTDDSSSISTASPFDSISFNYESGWPANLILTDSAINRYARLMRLLLRQSLALGRLSNLFTQLRRDTLVHGLISNQQARCLQLWRHEFEHAVKALGSYACHQTLDVCWTRLSVELNDAADLEAVRACHDRFLRRCLQRCLLEPGGERLLKHALLMMSLAERFCRLYRAYAWTENGDASGAAMVHPQFEALAKCRDMFRQNARFLFGLLARLRDRAAHLDELVLRLDFNGYYCLANSNLPMA